MAISRTSVRAIKAGAVEFLTKPWVDDDLIKAIRQNLAGSMTTGPRGGPRRLSEPRALLGAVLA